MKYEKGQLVEYLGPVSRYYGKIFEVHYCGPAVAEVIRNEGRFTFFTHNLLSAPTKTIGQIYAEAF